ncbi:DUF983 domain-containing protein [Sinomicrobium sp.]
MFKKGSRLYSIFTGTCPRCQEESMYTYKNLYHPAKTLKVDEQCSHCGLRYRIEPSFFYGAMYVSYGVGTAFAVAAFIISFFFFGSGLKTAFIAIMATLVVFMPVIMRVSRNIWINFFVHYDPNAVENHKKNTETEEKQHI